LLNELVLERVGHLRGQGPGWGPLPKGVLQHNFGNDKKIPKQKIKKDKQKAQKATKKKIKMEEILSLGEHAREEKAP